MAQIKNAKQVKSSNVFLVLLQLHPKSVNICKTLTEIYSFLKQVSCLANLSEHLQLDMS